MRSPLTRALYILTQGRVRVHLSLVTCACACACACVLGREAARTVPPMPHMPGFFACRKLEYARVVRSFLVFFPINRRAEACEKSARRRRGPGWLWARLWLVSEFLNSDRREARRDRVRIGDEWHADAPHSASVREAVGQRVERRRQPGPQMALLMGRDKHVRDREAPPSPAKELRSACSRFPYPRLRPSAPLGWSQHTSGSDLSIAAIFPVLANQMCNRQHLWPLVGHACPMFDRSTQKQSHHIHIRSGQSGFDH